VQVLKSLMLSIIRMYVLISLAFNTLFISIMLFDLKTENLKHGIRGVLIIIFCVALVIQHFYENGINDNKSKANNQSYR